PTPARKPGPYSRSDIMVLNWARKLLTAALTKKKALPAPRKSWRSWRATRLAVEILEDRISPSIRIWSGAGADANWSTKENWVGNVAPQQDDNLVFQTGALQLANNDDFAAGTRFRSVTIS